MADPSMQTFCCRPSPNISRSADLLLDFNTHSYNSLCLASSTIGIIGAVYQIWPRSNLDSPHRWLRLTSTRGRRIIIWLAVADLLASLGVFLRSVMWLYYGRMNFKLSEDVITISCAVSGAWVQYFYSATWLWTLVYALDMRQVLNNKPGYPYLYHVVVWVVPAFLTSTGLAILYAPKANCHHLYTTSSALLRILPNYFASYLPMAAVLIVNPLLYFSLSSKVENAVSTCTGQMTSKERYFVDLVKIKFLLINIVFYVCWLPNLINGILIWTLWFKLPQQVIIALWYIMAFTNPLQALFNALVYRRWSGRESMYLPFSPLHPPSTIIKHVTSSPPSNETTPLIGSSINGSSLSDDELL